MSIYAYIYKGNVQQKNPLCAASCVTKNIYPRYKFNNLTNTPMYSSRLYAKNTVFEIVHEESVKVYHLIYTCTTGIFSRTPYAQNPVSLRNFTYLLGSLLRFSSRCNVVVVVVFFTLTDRASTIPSNTRGCHSGTGSAGQKNIRGTSTKLQ